MVESVRGPRWSKSCVLIGYSIRIIVIIIYWPGVSLRWLDICVFIDPAFLLQGCALRKIEGSPALWTCEIQCAQQMISVKKRRFSSWPRTKVTDVGAKGHRAQPWSWSIKMQKWMRPIFSHPFNEQAWSINELLHGQGENFYLRDQRGKSQVGWRCSFFLSFFKVA